VPSPDPYDYGAGSPPNLGDVNARGMYIHQQRADPSPMNGWNSASRPFDITRPLEGLHTPMPLHGSEHQGSLYTGLPVAYNTPPSLRPSEMGQPTSGNDDAEWMAALEGMPIHNFTSSSISTKQQSVVDTGRLKFIPPREDPFLDFSVNPSLVVNHAKNYPPSSSLGDPRFTGLAENTALAPNSILRLQNDNGLGDLITPMHNGLGNSMETLERYLYHPLSGMPLHSWRHLSLK